MSSYEPQHHHEANCDAIIAIQSVVRTRKAILVVGSGDQDVQSTLVVRRLESANTPNWETHAVLH